MKTILSYELRKMFASRSLMWSILIGMAISSVNVVENYFLTQWFFRSQEIFYSPGYKTLSIFHNWINGAQMTVGETIFFTVFPLLAALPYSWSLWNEKSIGYTNQLLTRGVKRHYILAKYIAVFLSGGIAIVSAMIFNFTANAWILPLCDTMPVLTGSGDGLFLSRLLFTQPKIYIVLCMITSFFWAGTLACLGLTASLFLRNAIMSVLFPFVIFLGSSFLLEGLGEIYSDVDFLGKMETSPMQLLHAMTLNSNPAWYVWSILLGLLILVSIIYYVWGMRDEML